MPEIVSAIELPGPRIQRAGEINQCDPPDSGQREYRGLALPRSITEEKKSYGKSHEGKSRPGENRKQPTLRLTEVMYAVDVRLHRPRQPARTPTRPKQRSGERNHGCDG